MTQETTNVTLQSVGVEWLASILVLIGSADFVARASASTAESWRDMRASYE